MSVDFVAVCHVLFCTGCKGGNEEQGSTCGGTGGIFAHHLLLLCIFDVDSTTLCGDDCSDGKGRDWEILWMKSHNK